jgi:branched-chain amino acid transport system ATP-binding protein
MTLDITHVSRSFGGVKAVQDASLRVGPGQIIGLIGPNGAGKSSLVNLITGVLKLDSGSIGVDGRDVSTETVVGVSRAGVSRTFQNIRLLRDCTVLENVALGLSRKDKSSTFGCLIGLPSARRNQRATDQQALSILNQVGMASYAQRIASTLAYGHQRRVEIARAIAVNPKYILLDEPVAGMNDVEAAEIGELLKTLAASGIGILLIEHNMGFVNSLCSHVYALNTGSMLAEGSPSQIASNPVVVAAYLGA